MIIKCQALADFIENLKAAPPYNDTVFIDRTSTPRTVGTKEPTSFDWWFQASAVVTFEAGGQALLLCGVACGVDRISQPATREGSEKAESLVSELRQYCESAGIRVLPGMIDS